MSLAVKHALTNREVSHLTFPDDIQTQLAPKTEMAQVPDGRMPSFAIAPAKETFEKAVTMLKNAKRPVIVVGHGARFDMEAIIAFAESINAPVLTTFKGKGQIADSHPLGCGVLGRSGTPIASWFMNESDTLLVIGASFSNHTGITPKKPTIQIDFDALALSKFHAIDAPLWGEISTTVAMLTEKLDGQMNTIDQRPEIANRWKIWKAEKAKRLLENEGHGVSSMAIFDALTRLAPKNAIMCVDVGNNAYSFGRYFEVEKHSFLMSGYLGSIGFALPASMGAFAAVGNDRPIVAVAGDGGLCQYLAEISTLVKYNMPVKLIVVNNGELGKISKEQRAGEFDVWKTDLHNPDFAEYALSCGAWGKRVTDKETMEKAMQLMMAHDGPALLEIMADVNLI